MIAVYAWWLILDATKKTIKCIMAQVADDLRQSGKQQDMPHIRVTDAERTSNWCKIWHVVRKVEYFNLYDSCLSRAAAKTNLSVGGLGVPLVDPEFEAKKMNNELCGGLSLWTSLLSFVISVIHFNVVPTSMHRYFNSCPYCAEELQQVIRGCYLVATLSSFYV